METAVCVHRGKFPFCLSAFFSLFLSVSLSHILPISSDLVLVSSRTHAPRLQPRRQSTETVYLSQSLTLGTRDIPASQVQCHSMWELLRPFPPESVCFRSNTRDAPSGPSILPWAASVLLIFDFSILIF